MKKVSVFLLIISILLTLPIVAMSVSASFQADITTPEPAYNESYLTYHSEFNSPITGHVNYIDKKVTGASTVILEAKLGNNPNGTLAVSLNDNKTTTMYSSFSFKKALTFGASLDGYTYYDGKDQKGTDISEIYNDGISESTLFYSKTTYKIDIFENGTVDVYAKLTESKDVFLAEGGTEEVYNKLSANYVKLYTMEACFPEYLIKNGYYITFGVNQKNLVNDVVLHHITLLDAEGGILFADNFTNYGIVKDVQTNGYYAIPSNDLRAQIGTSVIATVGEAYKVPHFNLDRVPRTVYVGEEADLTPTLVNFEESYTVTVTKTDDTEVQLDSSNKYTFEQQGYYQVSYNSEGGITRNISVLVVNRSTQPTLELGFDKELPANRVVSENATVNNGTLVLNNGYLLTSGMSEAFILNLKVNGMTEGTDLSIVIGHEENKEYSLKLTAEGVSFYDYEGIETKYACKDLVTELINNRTVRIRVTLMGQKLTFSAIYENEQRELLGVELFTIDNIVYVGQIGVRAENGEVTLDSMQFVNLTSVKDDNTTTEAPLPKPEDNENDKPSSKPSEPVAKRNIFTIIADFFRKIFNFLFGWLF